MYIRIKVFRKLSTDDYFVFLAWLMALVTAAIWQARAKQLYLAKESKEQYIVDVSNITVSTTNGFEDVVSRVNVIWELWLFALCLCYSEIYQTDVIHCG